MLLYFLKANFAIVAIYLFFRLLFYKDTFFLEKRVAMLLSLAFIVAHPLFQISEWMISSESLSMVRKSLVYTLPEIDILANKANPFSWIKLIQLLYISIGGFLLLRIIVQTLRLVFMAKKGNKSNIKGVQVIAMPSGSSPFSFFGWAYLNTDDYSNSDLNEILEHERIHIQQLHSLDAILSELFCAAFWINPFSWMFKRLIRQNLEYLADRQVLKTGIASKNYQYHLLRLSHQNTLNRFGNHFNITELKQRIVMMNTKKTSLLGLGKYLLSLPMLAFLIVSTYAWSEKHQLPETVNNLLTGNEQPLLAAVQTPQAAAQNSQTAPQIPQVPNTKAVSTSAASPANSTNNEKNTSSPTYEIADIMPEYTGGEKALIEYIRNNLKYPQSAVEQNIEGRVMVRFVIDENGDVKDATILRGFNTECENEALRVVQNMPKWKPGSLKGKNVSVYYTLPINYKLNGGPINNATTVTPLLIVNNVEVAYSFLKDLKQEAIKSIIYLKDSVALSKYGEKGKNGVIQISTK